ncbi:MAG: hypothetical protein WAN74_08390 [Thermoplasmata archaeon]
MAAHRRKPRTRSVRWRPQARRLRTTPPAAPALAGPGPAHTHIVCRQCGRISHLTLTPEDLELLAALVERRPRDWTVDGISYSLTGICPRCAAGPA